MNQVSKDVNWILGISCFHIIQAGYIISKIYIHLQGMFLSVFLVIRLIIDPRYDLGTKVGDVISQTFQRQLTWKFWIEIIVKVVTKKGVHKVDKNI